MTLKLLIVGGFCLCSINCESLNLCLFGVLRSVRLLGCSVRIGLGWRSCCGRLEILRAAAIGGVRSGAWIVFKLMLGAAL